MLNKVTFSGIASRAVCLCLLLLSTLTVLPGDAAAKATVTKVSPFFIFDFTNTCLGEPVLFNLTLHLVERDDSNGGAEHGNWSQARGFGIFSGSTYVGQGLANLLPGAEGEYVITINYQGRGKGGKHFTTTMVGPLGGPPSEVRNIHCH